MILRHISPLGMIILALFLLLAGVALPFLMVIQVLESTFFLNFFAYLVSLGGLILGIIGVVLYFPLEQDDNEWEE